MNEQPDPRTGDPLANDEGAITTADLAGKNSSTAESGRHSEAQTSSANRGTAELGAATSPASGSTDEGTEPLFPADDAQQLRGRWDSIQAGFVDEPRTAVEAADSLVAAAMKRLAETFADERAQLEAQWDPGDDVSTEDLRVALRRYRSFFGRLLSM